MGYLPRAARATSSAGGGTGASRELRGTLRGIPACMRIDLSTDTMWTKSDNVAAPRADRNSRLKLALGAASLFFFVIGVKRTFRTEDGREILTTDEPVEGGGAGDADPSRSAARAN
jgi:hypothetical protein